MRGTRYQACGSRLAAAAPLVVRTQSFPGPVTAQAPAEQAVQLPLQPDPTIRRYPNLPSSSSSASSSGWEMARE